MSNRPSFKEMLPSEAKKELIRLIFERLEAARVNYHGDPAYRITDAMKEFGESVLDGSWFSRNIQPCFDAAMKEYDKKYPKNITAEKGIYRIGKE